MSRFGGNLDDITLIGQSAGAASVGVHVEAGIPGVKRAILMSGDPGIRPAVLAAVNEAIFTSIISFLSLTADTAISVVETISPENLYSKLPKDILNLPDLPLSVGTGSKLEALLVGDATHDGGIILPPRPPRSNLATVLHEYFTAALPASFVQLYQLQPTQSPAEAQAKLLDIFSDWAFYAPAVSRARELAPDRPVYLYHFDQRNEFPVEGNPEQPYPRSCLPSWGLSRAL